jgi:hypothetical protein
MNLDEYRAIVENSVPENWEVMEVQHLYRWDVPVQLASELRAVDSAAPPSTTGRLAVYKPDIDISLAMVGVDAWNVQATWAMFARRFADAGAHTHAVSVLFRYRGAVVYRWCGVEIDDGRGVLPQPKTDEAGNFVIRQDALPIARLILRLYSTQAWTLEELLRSCGIKVEP